jgi:ATP-dependent helicase/nuclease subunit B
MAIQRHFIGWDRPITDTVRRFLFPEAITKSVDLGDTLVVVPTRQASRRLRETLAAHCAASDAALLSAEVVLPAAFFRSTPRADQRLSSALLTQAVWTEILHAAPPTDFTTLFPTTESNRDLAWAERAGKTLQELRATLADGGYTIKSVVEQHADALEELERWQELTDAEERFLSRITELGYRDATLNKIEQADTPELADGIKRIVIASVPDPSLLMIRALKALESTVAIDILIAAPEQQADFFDAWGRPEPTPWKTRHIDIPNAEQAIQLAGTPKSQAAHTIRSIAEAAQQFGPADIAIGVPDRSVIPLLEANLNEHGLQAFDPTEKNLSEHPIFGALEDCLSLYTTRSYTALRNLLRHPDMLSYLKFESIPIDQLLADLDEFQGKHLPLRLDDVLAQLNPKADKAPYSGLYDPITATCDLIASFDTMPPAEAAQTLLQTLYRKRMISSKDPNDQAFSAAADKVAEIIRELAESQTLLHAMDTKTALRLLMQRLSEQTYHADREDSKIDLEGWLELPWNDAPFMIATGMNEGRVPDGRLSDVFLPDSLRQRLGLRNDAGRLARDAYLMTLMIESRRQSGKTIFVVGKTSSAGDPLKPSRLLFRCPQSELAARATALFSPIEEHDPHHASTVSFKLSPLAPLGNQPLTEAVNKLSVTSFRAYLACPFRFYLNSVLYMRSRDDSKREMDALDFGIMVHSALQSMGESEMWQANDKDQLADFLIAEAEATLATRFPKPAPLPVRLAIEAARQRLRQAAAVQVELVREGWDLIQTEKKFEMTIDGLPISGVIDRIDKHRETGAFRIIDYKTSDREATPISTHLSSCRDDTPPFAQVDVDGKAKRWTDLQLPLYHRLLQANGLLSGEAELAYFNLPKAVMQTGVSTWKGWSPQLADSAYTCAEAIVNQIRQGTFWPPAARVDYDDFETLFPSTPEDCFEALDTGGQKSEDRDRIHS